MQIGCAMTFEFLRQDIEDLILIKPKVFSDERGFFLESYKYSEFCENGICENFVQDNHSKSSYGVLRGLHYQLNPKAQGKLLRCIEGKIFDVAVDIRINSPTFAKWVGVELSEENKNIFYIPAGFAHGFVTLSESAQLLYKATDEYSVLNDRGIRWNDPQIGVDWSIDFEPILSSKDSQQPFLKEAEINFKYKE